MMNSNVDQVTMYFRLECDDGDVIYAEIDAHGEYTNHPDKFQEAMQVLKDAIAETGASVESIRIATKQEYAAFLKSHKENPTAEWLIQ